MPVGTKSCDTQNEYCVESGEYKTLKPSSSTSGGSSYWCGGSGGGMVFYSSTQAYCEKKTGATSGAMGMMWTGEEIKAVLNKLGSGWGLCWSGNSNCIEPGKTGQSNGWCSWYPPGTGGTATQPNGSTRTCPSLDGSTTPPTTEPPPIVGQIPLPKPEPEKNWIQHKWTFMDGTSESSILNRSDKEYMDSSRSTRSMRENLQK